MKICAWAPGTVSTSRAAAGAGGLTAGAAGFRGDEAFDGGASEEQALATVLPWLSEERVRRLCSSALDIYVRDRIGTEN